MGSFFRGKSTNQEVLQNQSEDEVIRSLLSQMITKGMSFDSVRKVLEALQEGDEVPQGQKKI